MVFQVFCKRLRAYRKLKQMNQREFAEQMGISVALVGGWERGTIEPTTVQIDKIMKILSVSRQELGLDDTE